ncbi:MAG: DUF6286 domain-containing protein [Actinomycetota bacterium]|nr:DUF6286 domain-containing protein [Actinomycetota bacterium]
MRATNRLISILLGLALAVVLLLAAIEVALARLDRNELTPWHARYRTLRAATWDATGTRVGFGILLAAGIVLLFLQLWRRRPVTLPLEEGPQLAPATVRRRHLDRALTGDTAHIDGVASSRVKAKRRRVDVDARTNRLNPGDLEQRLHTVVDGRISSLGLTEQLPVNVDLEHRKAPHETTGGRVQ